MVKYLIFLIASMSAVIGIFYLKKIQLLSIKNILNFNNIFDFILQVNLFLGILFYLIAFTVFLIIIHKYEVISAIPTLLGIYIITNGVASVYFYNETFTLNHLIAYLFIIIAIRLL